MESLAQSLLAHVHAEPFSLVATLLFFAAILHTFLTPRFKHWAHQLEQEHAALLKARVLSSPADPEAAPEVSFWAHVLHFFGEVEAVFGIWALVLMLVMGLMKGWPAASNYVGHEVNYTEPLFVVIIMALASTRPVLVCAEAFLRALASLGKGSIGAWWLSILIVGPLLSSFITEPGAMTIAALLLARQFYVHHPSSRLAYATIGLLFVNVSVGGTLTHFAAPPVLMVSGTWHWDSLFMLKNFGVHATVGIVLSTLLYYVFFRRELSAMEARRIQKSDTTARASSGLSVPVWIIVVNLLFIAVTVLTSHSPALFIAAFLFFLAFSQATSHYQGRLELRSPLMVGFFLAGLVVHGGLQAWWLAPILSRLSEWSLFLGATFLTSFNDNAAITYLASLVPDFSDTLKHAVVAGAVTGGGLTVIANAPNPAGQSILQRFFPDGVSPLGLALGALLPTIILGACFMCL